MGTQLLFAAAAPAASLCFARTAPSCVLQQAHHAVPAVLPVSACIAHSDQVSGCTYLLSALDAVLTH